MQYSHLSHGHGVAPNRRQVDPDHRKKYAFPSWHLFIGFLGLSVCGCTSHTNIQWTGPVIGGSAGALIGSQLASGKARFLTIILGAAAGVAAGMAIEKYYQKPSPTQASIPALASSSDLQKT